MTSTSEPDPQAGVLRLSAVALDLDVSIDAVYDLAKAGALPAFKVGGQWRITREDYAAWKAAQSKAATRRQRYALGL